VTEVIDKNTDFPEQHGNQDIPDHDGASRRNVLRAGAVGIAAVGLGAGKVLMQPSLQAHGFLSPDGILEGASQAVAAALIRPHSFTSSQVLPINSLGQPTKSFDANGNTFPAGTVRSLPSSTITAFNGSFPGPMVNTEYGKPVLIRFTNRLDENPLNLDLQDFGDPPSTEVWRLPRAPARGRRLSASPPQQPARRVARADREGTVDLTVFPA